MHNISTTDFFFFLQFLLLTVLRIVACSGVWSVCQGSQYQKHWLFPSQQLTSAKSFLTIAEVTYTPSPSTLWFCLAKTYVFIWCILTHTFEFICVSAMVCLEDSFLEVTYHCGLSNLSDHLLKNSLGLGMSYECLIYS